jgi:hypothetical protein
VKEGKREERESNKNGRKVAFFLKRAKGKSVSMECTLKMRLK